MIDGNFGFEMETMEFLSVLSSAGMPGNIFGILTHLDLFKKQDALKDKLGKTSAKTINLGGKQLFLRRNEQKVRK